jgi:hypothetical protein
VDEYSKSGPKTPKAAAMRREREMAAQMAELLAERDERGLVQILKNKYDLTPKDPRYSAFMQIWRDLQSKR